MSDPFDDRLRARLERLAAAIPVEPLAAGSGAPAARRRSLRAILAAASMLVVLSLGGAATFIALNQPQAGDGAFAAGKPLHCSGVDQMTPRVAERWMTTRGLESRWQLDDHGTTTHTDTAPDHGSIKAALDLDERTILILVDLTRDEPFPPRPCP